MWRLPSLVFLLLPALASASIFPDAFSDLAETVYARQDQGIGGEGSDQPPGVPYPPDIPFNGNRSLPYSPPYYPTPKVQGVGAWAEPVRRAREYIKDWTLQERVDLVTGVGWQNGPCVGNIAANEKRGFKGLCLMDSPLGVRFADLVNVFPAGITLAATFDGDLAYQRGVAMGKEHRAKGSNIQLGPGMNFLRAPAAGRNWEMGGADPYLNGEAAYETIKGVQSTGVQACAKHYIANDQEHFRNQYSANIDARTLREIYLHPFMRSVQADVSSVMCSYNLNNNSWSCQNSELLNGVLKTELNFQGHVVSDWGAQHAGVASANAGLDVTMPGDENCCYQGQNSSFWGRNLTMAIKNGSVEASRLEDMGVRILAGYFMTGQDKDDYPKTNFDAFDLTTPINKHVNVNKLFNHAPIIREIGAAGTVLVKNAKKKNGHRALPLKTLKGHTPNRIAVIGSDAAPAYLGANGIADRGGVDGILGEGWGSGTADYSIFISPYEALQARAAKDGTGYSWLFNDFDYSQARKIADERIGTDAAIVFLQSDSGEGYLTVDGNAGDRNNLTAWHAGDRLVKEVASVNPNTIVVYHHPAQVDVERFIENENVTAVLFAHMPGREAGHAIADVLYGDYNPSGRLPYTVAKERGDYPVDVTYVNRSSTEYVQLNYTEKLLVDYRYFDAKGIEPRYEFGYGLSYTTFGYSSARGAWLDTAGGTSHWGAARWAHKPHTHGLPDDLFEDVYSFSFTVKNTGDRDGHEVPQAYLAFPKGAGEPPKVLRKFARVFLKKGQSKTITWKLNRYDFSTFDAKKGMWLKPEGEFKILIGQSSRKIRETIQV